MPSDPQSDPQGTSVVPGGKASEWHTLRELRLSGEQDGDLWTPTQFAHLRFLRWLAETGRLVEDGGCAAGQAVA